MLWWKVSNNTNVVKIEHMLTMQRDMDQYQSSINTKVGV